MKFKDTKFGDLTGQVYEGDITVDEMGITSLEGAPKEVTGHFDCEGNELTSLKYAPEKTGGGFYCPRNKLTSLKYAPKEVGSSIDCRDNPIPLIEVENELIKNEIVAKRYFTNKGTLKTAEIHSAIDMYKKQIKSIKSKGFKAFLGLKNEI